MSTVAPVINVDIEKVKGLMAKGVDGVAELSTYLKGLITENIKERVVTSLNEEVEDTPVDKDGNKENDEIEDIENNIKSDKKYAD